VVEQIDVGEPDRVFADLVGILAVPGRKVGRPTETVDVSGALQPFQEALVMRDGIRVARLMLIQNASDSINPPLRPSIRTRISHHRLEVPEHQRRRRSTS
jgi:hypothetical protein